MPVTTGPTFTECIDEVIMVHWIGTTRLAYMDEELPKDHDLYPAPRDIEQYGVLVDYQPTHIVVASGQATPVGKESPVIYEGLTTIPVMSIVNWRPLTNIDSD